MTPSSCKSFPLEQLYPTVAAFEYPNLFLQYRILQSLFFSDRSQQNKFFHSAAQYLIDVHDY